MRLPDTVYNQVLRGLGLNDHGISNWSVDAAAAESAPAECKRRSFRRRIDATVHFVRHGALNARPQTCVLADLSRDGVCVLMDTVVAPGDKFVVYLPRAVDDESGNGEPLAVLCTARSSRLKAGGKFRTGAEFTDERGEDNGDTQLALGADGLKQRGAAGNVWVRTAGRLDTEPDANARRSDRHETYGRATMHVYRDDGQHGPMEEVSLRDYSESGVGILRGEPMAPGDQFVIRVPRGGGDAPITRLCRVVNTAVAGGGHRIGAEFIPFPGPTGRSLLSRLVRWIA